MRKLFNNPKFVIGLGILAVAYLAYSVFMPLVNSDDSNESIDEFAESLDILSIGSASESSELDLSTYSRVDREKIDWLSEPLRDPFSTMVLHVEELSPGAPHPENLKKKVSVNAVTKEEVLVLPKLSALFHRPSQSLAVLDGILIREGGRVSGFKVESIGKYQVIVERLGMQYTLVPDRGS